MKFLYFVLAMFFSFYANAQSKFKDSLDFESNFFKCIDNIESYTYHKKNQDNIEVNSDLFLKSLQSIGKYIKVDYGSLLNYSWGYPTYEAFEQDKKKWIDWYEKKKYKHLKWGKFEDREDEILFQETIEDSLKCKALNYRNMPTQIQEILNELLDSNICWTDCIVNKNDSNYRKLNIFIESNKYFILSYYHRGKGHHNHLLFIEKSNHSLINFGTISNVNNLSEIRSAIWNDKFYLKKEL